MKERQKERKKESLNSYHVATSLSPNSQLKSVLPFYYEKLLIIPFKKYFIF